MSSPDVPDALRRLARRAGEQVEAARREYRRGRVEGTLPTDGAGNARIVCRRDAERRSVQIEDGRPTCYEASHPACRSCAVDVEEGVVETW